MVLIESNSLFNLGFNKNKGVENGKKEVEN
jgi:hypothetical protein